MSRIASDFTLRMQRPALTSVLGNSDTLSQTLLLPAQPRRLATAVGSCNWLSSTSSDAAPSCGFQSSNASEPDGRPKSLPDPKSAYPEIGTSNPTKFRII